MWYEVYRDERGKWRWRLWSDGGEPIAEAAEAYAAKARCLYDLALNKASASAPVRELMPS
ncbi:MAG: DUF1508 domain-containing protein [Rhodospirillales bacterium]